MFAWALVFQMELREKYMLVYTQKWLKTVSIRILIYTIIKLLEELQSVTQCLVIVYI